MFAYNSDRNAIVNGIFKTGSDVKYAIGDRYTLASLDEATIKTAAGKLLRRVLRDHAEPSRSDA